MLHNATPCCITNLVYWHISHKRQKYLKSSSAKKKFNRGASKVFCMQLALLFAFFALHLRGALLCTSPISAPFRALNTATPHVLPLATPLTCVPHPHHAPPFRHPPPTYSISPLTPRRAMLSGNVCPAGGKSPELPQQTPSRY